MILDWYSVMVAVGVGVFSSFTSMMTSLLPAVDMAMRYDSVLLCIECW